MSEERKAFWAECGDCQHCWPAAYLPMEAHAAAKLLLRAACPMCASRRVFVAKQENGALLEKMETR